MTVSDSTKQRRVRLRMEGRIVGEFEKLTPMERQPDSFVGLMMASDTPSALIYGASGINAVDLEYGLVNDNEFLDWTRSGGYLGERVLVVETLDESGNRAAILKLRHCRVVGVVHSTDVDSARGGTALRRLQVTFNGVDQIDP